MKRFTFISLSLTALFLGLVLVGCEQSDQITTPNTDNSTEVTIGLVHTEVLDQIYADLTLAKAAKGNLDRLDKDLVVIAAVNKISDRYGVERMSPEEILSEIERGRQMAQQDPVQLVASFLTAKEQVWWDRFSTEAEVKNARKVYERHCQLYGTPDYNSTLGQFLDVGLSSAEFWGNYRDNQQPIYQNPYVPQDKSWRNVLRFVVAVVVDGGAGALSSGGGPIASGIVGGLCSHGADDLLFGD